MTDIYTSIYIHTNEIRECNRIRCLALRRLAIKVLVSTLVFRLLFVINTINLFGVFLHHPSSRGDFKLTGHWKWKWHYSCSGEGTFHWINDAEFNNHHENVCKHSPKQVLKLWLIVKESSWSCLLSHIAHIYRQGKFCVQFTGHYHLQSFKWWTFFSRDVHISGCASAMTS